MTNIKNEIRKYKSPIDELISDIKHELKPSEFFRDIIPSPSEILPSKEDILPPAPHELIREIIGVKRRK